MKPQTGRYSKIHIRGSWMAPAPMSVTSTNHRGPCQQKKYADPGRLLKKITGPPRQSIGGPSQLSETGKNNPLLLLGFVLGLFACEHQGGQRRR